ncbi:hypothetical protein JCM8547_008453 [Rhodosporidiobolus lusitaniae]
MWTSRGRSRSAAVGGGGGAGGAGLRVGGRSPTRLSAVQEPAPVTVGRAEEGGDVFSSSMDSSALPSSIHPSSSSIPPLVSGTVFPAPSAVGEEEVLVLLDEPHLDSHDEQEDVGRQLLNQWTFASPSPKRKRARTLTGSQVEGVKMKGEEEKDRSRCVVFSDSFAILPSSSSSLTSKTTDLLPSAIPPISSFPSFSFSALELSFDAPPPPTAAAFKTPSRPARPVLQQRSASIGTALSSLSLANTEVAFDEGKEQNPPEPPASLTAEQPVSSSSPTAAVAATSSMTTATKQAEPSLVEALTTLLAKENLHRLPEGLLPLLEAVVKEGHAASEGAVSALAAKLGLTAGSQQEQVEHEEKQQEEKRMMPPPSLSASRVRSGGHHHRSFSSSSYASLASIATTATSSSSLRSRRSTSSFATSLSSFSSSHSTPAPPPSSRQLRSPSPPLPYRPHPPYPPKTFTRPLRFIYETGTSTFEEQREERTARAQAEEGEEDGEWRRKEERECVRGGRRKASATKRRVSWREVYEEEEGEAGVKYEDEEEESEGEVRYLPRSSRSRSRAASAVVAPVVPPPAAEKGRGEGKGKAKEVAPAVEVEEDGPRRSKRARRKA